MKGKDFKGYRSWALITGAASGMGRIYAIRLACMGYNIVLVDINSAGLEETESVVMESVSGSSEIPQDLKTKVKVMKIV